MTPHRLPDNTVRAWRNIRHRMMMAQNAPIDPAQDITEADVLRMEKLARAQLRIDAILEADREWRAD